MLTNIKRTSALTCRHKDLGGKLKEYIRMAVPMTYGTSSVEEEHDAVRHAAGLYDLTAFLKFYVRGKDACKAINHAMLNDISKLTEGQSKYGPFLRDDGTICDDGIVFNLGKDEYIVFHGDGCARKMVEASAQGLDAEIDVDDSVHLISLQGPKSCGILAPHTPSDLPALKYFRHVRTTLFGCPCVISRTGYSGERGYEIFATPDTAPDIWDNILLYGKKDGVLPCALDSLFPLRMEAGLVWRRYDLMEQTPWEAGLGWAVNKNKEADYRGKDAVRAAEGMEHFMLRGIEIDINHALEGGEELLVGDIRVGTVNGAPAYSSMLGKSLAWSRIVPLHAAIGTRLVVKRKDGSKCGAVIVPFPVYDPKKEKTRA